ncbi:hypothetical protein AMTR_s00315p00013590 [Amborella trichopoda]|uniref:Uncharacterized protein n=1 Tax=Amborella trichopoda TaxID=13333 RepID=U5D0Z4_AMBTC|nr:hypothetical protein AMTR_s00315p00013590 [Amborella trichopoda]
MAATNRHLCSIYSLHSSARCTVCVEFMILWPHALVFSCVSGALLQTIQRHYSSSHFSVSRSKSLSK